MNPDGSNIAAELEAGSSWQMRWDLCVRAKNSVIDPKLWWKI